mgnify:CR=1 FL=1
METDDMKCPFRFTFPDDRCIKEQCAVWVMIYKTCNCLGSEINCDHEGIDVGYCGLRGKIQ